MNIAADCQGLRLAFLKEKIFVLQKLGFMVTKALMSAKRNEKYGVMLSLKCTENGGDISLGGGERKEKSAECKGKRRMVELWKSLWKLWITIRKTFLLKNLCQRLFFYFTILGKSWEAVKKVRKTGSFVAFCRRIFLADGDEKRGRRG